MITLNFPLSSVVNLLSSIEFDGTVCAKLPHLPENLSLLKCKLLPIIELLYFLLLLQIVFVLVFLFYVAFGLFLLFKGQSFLLSLLCYFSLFCPPFYGFFCKCISLFPPIIINRNLVFLVFLGPSVEFLFLQMKNGFSVEPCCSGCCFIRSLFALQNSAVPTFNALDMLKDAATQIESRVITFLQWLSFSYYLFDRVIIEGRTGISFFFSGRDFLSLA